MSTTVLFLVAVAVIAANQAVLRLAVLCRSPWAFWPLQVFNLAIACYLFLYGIPGFEADYARWFGIVIGLLLIFRIVQNNMLRQRYLRAEIEEEREEERRERARELAERLARESEEGGSPDRLA